MKIASNCAFDRFKLLALPKFKFYSKHPFLKVDFHLPNASQQGASACIQKRSGKHISFLHYIALQPLSCLKINIDPDRPMKPFKARIFTALRSMCCTTLQCSALVQCEHQTILGYNTSMNLALHLECYSNILSHYSSSHKQ